MTDATVAALVGLATVFVNVILAVVVGSWAARRKTQDAVTSNAETSATAELSKVRDQYRRRVERLEERLEEKDKQFATIQESNATLRESNAQLRAKVSDLEQTVEGLKLELANCLGTHDRRPV